MGWGLCVIQDRQVSVRYVSKMEFCSICELCEKTYTIHNSEFTIQNYDYHRRKSKKVKGLWESKKLKCKKIKTLKLKVQTSISKVQSSKFKGKSIVR